jgi:small subunit ribosomal protein S6
MKNNFYETAVIINAVLDDEQIAQVIARVKDYVSGNGGMIQEIEDWGRRRLAYMIKKNKIGYYLFIRFSGPSNIISKLERNYKLDEHILRFLTIKLDKYALEYFEKQKSSSHESKDQSSDNKKEETAQSEVELSEND